MWIHGYAQDTFHTLSDARRRRHNFFSVLRINTLFKMRKPLCLDVVIVRGAVKKFPEFFDIDGLMLHEFVPPGRSVTGHYAVRRKRCDKWQAGTVVSAPR
jgi:hypothetical protein